MAKSKLALATQTPDILKSDKDLSAWHSAFDRAIDLGPWSYDSRLSLVSDLNPAHVQASGAFLASKRLFDMVFAVVAILLLAPILIAIAVAIRVDSAGPIFYCQARVGLRLKAFKIFKFRSMYSDLPKVAPIYDLSLQGYRRPSVEEDPRITAVGRFLRRWSLDELPQLFNILTGDMALIGPRPLGVEEALKIPQAAFCRYAVLPGLTGLAQITSRGAVIGPSRFRSDIEYLKNLGPRQDVKIFFKTFGALRDKGDLSRLLPRDSVHEALDAGSRVSG